MNNWVKHCVKTLATLCVVPVIFYRVTAASMDRVDHGIFQKGTVGFSNQQH